MVVTFAIVRAMLHSSPDSDFNVAGYNIHHLFTGLLLITISAIPLAVFSTRSRVMDMMALVLGVGLSLALDEWVYLIVTDGTNASYLLPVSFNGGVLMVALAAGYIGILYLISKKKAGAAK